MGRIRRVPHGQISSSVVYYVPVHINSSQSVRKIKTNVRTVFIRRRVLVNNQCFYYDYCGWEITLGL